MNVKLARSNSTTIAIQAEPFVTDDNLIQPSTQGSEVDRKTVARQGYHLFHWTKVGMTYWVVSDLNESELQ